MLVWTFQCKLLHFRFLLYQALATSVFLFSTRVSIVGKRDYATGEIWTTGSVILAAEASLWTSTRSPCCTSKDERAMPGSDATKMGETTGTENVIVDLLQRHPTGLMVTADTVTEFVFLAAEVLCVVEDMFLADLCRPFWRHKLGGCNEPSWSLGRFEIWTVG